MTQPLLIIGASGHAHSLLALLHRHGGFEPLGLIDSFQSVGAQVHGLFILGAESDVPELCQKHRVSHLVVAIGDNFQRHAMMYRLLEQIPDIIFPTLVDPTAVVASDADLFPGVVVMAQAHVGAGCLLQMGSLLNTQASLDHGCHLSTCASLAPGAITGGGARIGARSFIGLGSRLIQKLQIGSDTVVGAGSLVLHDLPDGVLAYGAPARVVRIRQADEPII